ncbi:Gfo/Idh/MocA family protein [Enterococcus sp. BWR-S5]|uniref:Gfo/Idh/MocA family protein n=1 Tax=Enterococcus sp. BWR-S5 TaxID=2787714 RepID=UPI00192516A2|nr:Gfo/Idh/MocA family oxidoreductase [Enterococcus sp. BWR-S5]MBL1223546.1 Gfo/Idh/MocA family oxidoreductase [Enterococcus sp. BWR-S5]
MKRVRYGILSTAQIVPRFVRGIRESKVGEVTTIASRDLERAKEAAEKLEIPKAYGSYEALCLDQEVDIVYIATYNKGHYEAAKLALTHKKHVLLEKPFTLIAAEAEELFALARKNDCFLMEAQKAVFLPITSQVKQVIEQGAIGRVRHIRSVTAYPNIEHLKWFHSLDAGGGVLHSSGSYPLEYIQYILGSAPNGYTGYSSMEKGRSDDQFELVLKFPGQVLASVFITVQLDIPSEMVIYGEKGKITIPYFWKTDHAAISYNDGREESLTSTVSSEFVFEVNHVNECILSGLQESPIMTEKLTVDTVGLVEEMYKQWL